MDGNISHGFAEFIKGMWKLTGMGKKSGKESSIKSAAKRARALRAKRIKNQSRPRGRSLKGKR
jgi:hypothetical protein